MDDLRHPVPAAPAVRSGTPPPVAEPGARTRWRRVRGPVLVAGLVGGLSLALHLRDPHDGGSWGICPWLTLTGRYCPGCGALRAVDDLTHGDVAAAVSSNLLLVAAVPLALWLWARWAGRAWSSDDPTTPPARSTSIVLVAAAAVVVLAFTVLRNLPYGAWLAP